MDRPRPSLLFSRVVRLRCPACGGSPLFASGLRRAESCDVCGFRYERCEGHWIGGSEVHMLVTFALTWLVGLPLLFLANFHPVACASVVVGHLVLSIGFVRHSRAIFLALDFYLDPEPVPRTDDRGGGPPVRSRRRPDPPTGGEEPSPDPVAVGAEDAPGS